MGAVLVSVSLVTVRTLGAGGVVAATVSGQVVVSAILDRFGFLGLDRIGLTPARLLGLRPAAGGHRARHRAVVRRHATVRSVNEDFELRLPFRAPLDG